MSPAEADPRWLCCHLQVTERPTRALRDTELRRFGLRLAERGGTSAKKRAVVAVARRLAVLLHRLWVTGEVYQPLGYDRSLALLGKALSN